MAHHLTREQVSDYLAAASGALTDVQAALDADPALWEFLQSPLVLNIVALTYQDRSADALRAAGTPQERLTLLFTAYTERMLAYRPSTARYTPAQMRHWLTWLARSMQRRGQSEFHVDRLRPAWLPAKAQRLAILTPPVIAGLLSILVSGLVGGLLGGFVFGLVLGVTLGVVYALATVLITGLRKAEPVEELYWSWPGLRHVLLGVLTGGRRGLVLGGVGFGLAGALFVGSGVGLGFDVPGGLGLPVYWSPDWPANRSPG